MGESGKVMKFISLKDREKGAAIRKERAEIIKRKDYCSKEKDWNEYTPEEQEQRRWYYLERNYGHNYREWRKNMYESAICWDDIVRLRATTFKDWYLRSPYDDYLYYERLENLENPPSTEDCHIVNSGVLDILSEKMLKIINFPV